MNTASSLLKRDHRNVEALFDEYRFAAPDSKRTILENITRELTKHMLAEEGVLYPVLRTFVPDGETLMKDAVEEHKEAKGLLAELENAEAGSFEMDSKVATLVELSTITFGKKKERSSQRWSRCWAQLDWRNWAPRSRVRSNLRPTIHQLPLARILLAPPLLGWRRLQSTA